MIYDLYVAQISLEPGL